MRIACVVLHVKLEVYVNRVIISNVYIMSQL